MEDHLKIVHIGHENTYVIKNGLNTCSIDTRSVVTLKHIAFIYYIVESEILKNTQ